MRGYLAKRLREVRIVVRSRGLAPRIEVLRDAEVIEIQLRRLHQCAIDPRLVEVREIVGGELQRFRDGHVSHATGRLRPVVAAPTVGARLTLMGNEQQTLDPVNGAAPPRASSKTPLWIALAGLGGLVIGVIGTLGVVTLTASVGEAAAAAAAAAAVDTRLADAVDECGSTGMELGDEDQTLVIDVKGDEDARGATYQQQECVLAELDVPASVNSHIGQTTSMDGRQTESWDGITIEWSYHPDRGSDMVITLDEDAD